MYPLTRQDIRQTDPRRQHLHPYLACLRSGDIFFDGCDHFRATVVSDHNSHVAHVPDPFASNFATNGQRSPATPETPQGFWMQGTCPTLRTMISRAPG